MQKFLQNTAWFLLVPVSIFTLLAITYLVMDPFKVLYKNEIFYDVKEKGTVGMNKDFISTENFLNHYQKEKYNSFILGNSRSFNYRITDWKPLLPPNSSCFHFDAANETLFGIYRKVEFLNSHGSDISNALIVLDKLTLETDRSRHGSLFIISPKLVDNKNLADFHWTHFKTFVSPVFLYAFLDFKFSGEVKPYMQQSFLINKTMFILDHTKNELLTPQFDSLIKSGDYYTPEIMSTFYKRDTIQWTSPQTIFENQKSLLLKIALIFKNKKTNVKLVINPMYDQVKLNEEDLQFLKTTFGVENVFDYSGINQVTADYKNYYESSHYRPEVLQAL